MSSNPRETIPVKTVKISIEGMKTEEDGVRAGKVLRGVDFVNTAVVLRDRHQAIVTVPAAFSGFNTLEKALADAGYPSRLIDPVHLTLKVARTDGVVDLTTLSTQFLMVKGAAMSVPEPTGDALAIYADPAQIDLAEVEKIATGQGYQAQISSHEFVDVKIDAMDCKMKEQLVLSALTGLNGVIFAKADAATQIARVLVARGTMSPEGVIRALAEEGYSGNWCPRGEESCEKDKEAAKPEHPEHPVQGQ